MQIQKDATLTGAIGNWSCRDDYEKDDSLILYVYQ